MNHEPYEIMINARIREIGFHTDVSMTSLDPLPRLLSGEEAYASCLPR